MGVVGKETNIVVETHLQQNTTSPGLRVEGAKQLWREALVLFEVACSEVFFQSKGTFFLCVDVSNPRKIEGIFLKGFLILRKKIFQSFLIPFNCT